MSYLRQHRETGEVRAIALVSGQPGRFRVQLSAGEPNARRSMEGLQYYPSREIAFNAADILARHQLPDHECSGSCSGWMEPVHSR
jgi:hypothetical protein